MNLTLNRYHILRCFQVCKWPSHCQIQSESPPLYFHIHRTCSPLTVLDSWAKSGILLTNPIFLSYKLQLPTFNESIYKTTTTWYMRAVFALVRVRPLYKILDTRGLYTPSQRIKQCLCVHHYNGKKCTNC